VIDSPQRREASPAPPTRVIPFPAPADDTSVDVNLIDVDWPAAALWWFEALDGRSLGDGAHRSTVQVAGMHLEGSDIWIQLQSSEDPSHCFLLHVVRGATWWETISRMCPSRDR
jgi:hypothetical protein